MAKTARRKNTTGKTSGKTVRKLASTSPARRPAAKRSAKVTHAHAEPAIHALGEVWPLERDVLYRPDRFKYVRKIAKPQGCVFCKAAKQKPSFETLCVYQSEHSMVLLNKFPYNSGHVLVLPREHGGDLLKLSQEAYVDLMNTFRLAMGALNEKYEPGGMNAGLNHGATAGAGIPEHLHFHLIPRWSGDLNFFPLIADTKVVIESLDQTWDRLHSYFESHNGGRA